jgi:pimeloyl-ACP methyl ester carboxylesterase
VTAPVYGGIRVTTGAVGNALDVLLAKLDPLLGESVPSPERDAFVAALNGLLGDYLAATGNPLALSMDLRRAGEPLALDRRSLSRALPESRRRLLVLVHGSSMNDQGWRRRDHDHGEVLERERGLVSLYARYNSGLHVSENGALLAALLEQLAAASPIDELVLVCHSMGGLVARSACVAAEAASHAWRRKLVALVTIGTPHHGAPLERGGSWLHMLLGVSSYSAPLARLAKVRSAGVTDLRFGNVVEADWRGRDRFVPEGDTRQVVPLPSGVRCYAVAGTTARRTGGRLPGDGLVPVASALGEHRDETRSLGFPDGHKMTALRTDHLGLLASAEVAAALLDWLE